MNRSEDQVAPAAGSREKPAEPDNIARLAHAMNEYLEAVESGQYPDRETWVKRYPDIADELSVALEGLDFIQNVAPQLADPLEAQIEGGARAINSRLSLGDFRVIRQLGKGGMGVVYEAEQLSLGRRVALKVLPFAAVLEPKQVQRFRNEAHAAAQLHHQNIVPVYSVGCERGVHYYAMQYVEGQTLANLIGQLRELGRLQAGDEQGNSNNISDTTRQWIARLTDSTRIGRSHGTPASEAADTQPVASLTTERPNTGPAYFRTIAELGIQVAEALDYAHQQGIVHRDIKPSNLLLDDLGDAERQHTGHLTDPENRS